MTDAIAKADLFARLGYAGLYDLLEAALEEAGLSRAAKKAISPDKQDDVAALLADRFIAVCSRGDCQADAPELADGRTLVAAVSSLHCEVCHGSSNARAVDAMIDALTRAGMRRLCVVGGSPNTRHVFEELVAGRIELRMVDGTGSRNSAQARADLAWADRVAIWGATMLDHKVSLLYQGRHVIQLARRGIRELAREVERSVSAAP